MVTAPDVSPKKRETEISNRQTSRQTYSDCLDTLLALKACFFPYEDAESLSELGATQKGRKTEDNQPKIRRMGRGYYDNYAS